MGFMGCYAIMVIIAKLSITAVTALLNMNMAIRPPENVLTFWEPQEVTSKILRNKLYPRRV